MDDECPVCMNEIPKRATLCPICGTSRAEAALDRFEEKDEHEAK